MHTAFNPLGRKYAGFIIMQVIDGTHERRLIVDFHKLT